VKRADRKGGEVDCPHVLHASATVPRSTNATNLIASFWEYYGGRGAFEYWNDLASRHIFEHRLQDDPLQAAQVYALMNIASHDVAVACWDAKYTYWTPRPTMLDPTISTLFVTPNHPSYPSAHSCLAGAMGSVLAKFFPAESGSLEALVEQIGESRIMGGIHYRSDMTVGVSMGRSVGEVIWARANP
jgi:hypothetical protein